MTDVESKPRHPAIRVGGQDSRDADARRRHPRRRRRLRGALDPVRGLRALSSVVAYGLPALLEGRWWTPFTGTFFVNHPVVYIFTIASFVGMAYLECRRGSRVALAYFGVGQLFAIFGSALLLWLFALLPWPWAQVQAMELDVGPSGGTLACLAAAAGLLAAPWRVRAWVVLLGFIVVTLFFWGSLADLEHALAVVLVLFVDRSLRISAHHPPRTATHRVRHDPRAPGRRGADVLRSDRRAVRPDVRGGRLDPGHRRSTSSSSLILANGLRRGRRWAWVLSIILAVFNVLTGILFVFLLLFVAARPDQQLGRRPERGHRAVGGVGRPADLPHLGAGRLPRASQGDDRHRRRAHGRRREEGPAGPRRRDAVVDDDVGREQLRPNVRRASSPTRSGRASPSCWPTRSGPRRPAPRRCASSSRWPSARA